MSHDLFSYFDGEIPRYLQRMLTRPRIEICKETAVCTRTSFPAWRDARFPCLFTEEKDHAARPSLGLAGLLPGFDIRSLHRRKIPDSIQDASNSLARFITNPTGIVQLSCPSKIAEFLARTVSLSPGLSVAVICSRNSTLRQLQQDYFSEALRVHSSAEIVKFSTAMSATENDIYRAHIVVLPYWGDVLREDVGAYLIHPDSRCRLYGIYGAYQSPRFSQYEQAALVCAYGPSVFTDGEATMLVDGTDAWKPFAAAANSNRPAEAMQASLRETSCRRRGNQGGPQRGRQTSQVNC